MNGCVYQTADGQCWKFSDKFTNTLSWCVGVNLCKDRKLSNADRIRTMSDEELADFLGGKGCLDCKNECEGAKCESCWLKWLKQEAV